jgi:hypothetical protein
MQPQLHLQHGCSVSHAAMPSGSPWSATFSQLGTPSGHDLCTIRVKAAFRIGLPFQSHNTSHNTGHNNEGRGGHLC